MSDEFSSDGNIESTVMHAHEAAATREKQDPEIGREPISLWAFFLCSAALLAGGGYLGATSGGFSFTNFTVSGYEPESPGGGGAGEVGEKDPVLEWRKKGKRTYGTTCIGCHQAAGTGVPGQYPPLVKSEWVLGGTERFSQVVLGGLRGPIEVLGKGYGSIEMPPHKDKLSDTQIAQVMSYVRYEWGNGIEPIVTKEMVAESRSRHGGHDGSWTAAELAPADAELPGGPPPAGDDAGADAAKPADPPADPPAN
jgi:mono/diheme cytochrome c family protein